MKTNDRYCSNCQQHVKPTSGAFAPAYITAICFTAAALTSSGGPPALGGAFALATIVDLAIFLITSHFFPEGACPMCKTTGLTHATT